MICAWFGLFGIYIAKKSGLLDAIDALRGSPMKPKR